MRSSYGGPGTARSTWKPTLDPGKQAPAAATNPTQHGGKPEGNRSTGNSTSGQKSSNQNETDEK